MVDMAADLVTDRKCLNKGGHESAFVILNEESTMHRYNPEREWDGSRSNYFLSDESKG